MSSEESRVTNSDGPATPADVLDLVRRYVLQETVGPLRHLGKRLLYGAAGGLLLGVGLVLLLIAALRVLQTQTGSFFAGDMSFGPYLATAFLGMAVVALAALSLWRMLRRGSGD